MIKNGSSLVLLIQIDLRVCKFSEINQKNVTCVTLTYTGDLKI